ncbi:MAG: long-chain-fatty-acid--CoA ligase [Candidatus Thermoplasmatota archaeon]
MIIPLTPVRFLERSAKYYPNESAVICGELRLSYNEYWLRVLKLAGLFNSLGCRDGTKIAYITNNCHIVLEACYATLLLGCIRVPINTRLAVHEWKYILNDCKPEILVIEDSFLSKFSEIRKEISSLRQIIIIGLDYEKLLANATPAKPNWVENDENKVVEIFYTSGTTGLPKGVMLTSRNLYVNAVNFFLPFCLRREDVYLHSLPLYHINGWGAPHFMVACGGRQVILKRFSPEGFLELVEKEKVTLTCMVPTMLSMVVNYPKLDKYNISTLRLINTGGARLSHSLGIEAMKKLKCEVIGGYGLTETSPLLTLAIPKSQDKNSVERFSTGLETLDARIKVVDNEGKEVLWDNKQIGEIIVQGNVVMHGYLNSPEEKGWFHTGDLAVVSPQGYIQIVDRKKDIIISGGENIPSLEVENVLSSHEAVEEVAVIAAPHEKWGETPKALVVLKPGAKATESELISFCKERMTNFKVPTSVEFYTSLPKSATGKILKRELRKKYWKL